jgi:hypothetical protein
MSKLCVNVISGWRTKVATAVSEMHRFTSRETAELQSWGKRASNFDSRLLFSASGTSERVSSNSELSFEASDRKESINRELGYGYTADSTMVNGT